MGDPRDTGPRARLRSVAAAHPVPQETSIYKYDLEGASYLEVIEGVAKGKRIPLVKKILTIGRSSDADLPLADQDVSSRHAEVVREGDSFVLRDVGSRNGIEHNGQLTDELFLSHGDEFRICRNRFRFVSPEGDDILEPREITEVTATGSIRPRRRRRATLLVALAVVVTGGVTAVVLLAGSDLPAVTVALVARGPLQQTTSVSGRLVPKNDVRLFASVSAPVVKVIAKEGQRVKKGDPIVALDPEILGMAFERSKAEVAASQAAVRAAEGNLRSAERKLREDRALARKGILSRAEVDRSNSAVDARRSERQSARARLRTAEARQAQAKRDHADTVVRAPIDGQVTSVNIKVGESPHDLAGLPVATIEDASELLAEATAGESKIGLLRPGQVARVRVSGAGFGTEFAGRIAQIAPKAERPGPGGTGATRYTAKVSLDKQDKRLRPGMQVQVRVVTAEKASALTVPLSAVVTGGRSEHGMVERVARVHKNGTVRWVPIQTDLVSTDRVEITAGPKEGSVVVSGPVELLLELNDGDAVRIVKSR